MLSTFCKTYMLLAWGLLYYRGEVNYISDLDAGKCQLGAITSLVYVLDYLFVSESHNSPAVHHENITNSHHFLVSHFRCSC
jgi:hypothetical protein